MPVTTLERIEGCIGLVRIDRPDARNALNAEVRNELQQHMATLAEEEPIRCVVIAGSDKVFAAGADLKAMMEARVAEIMMQGGERVWATIRSFPKPIIAAVNGWALGGGCELAMHADIIIAGESAKFGQPEVKVGIVPGGGGTQRLVRALGKFKAMKMLLTGEPVTAREAEAMSLVSEVTPDDQVMPRALDLARAISALPPIAVVKIKQLATMGPEMPLEAALVLERQTFQLMFDTEDQKEGMRAFFEKRPPVFKGR